MGLAGFDLLCRAKLAAGVAASAAEKCSSLHQKEGGLEYTEPAGESKWRLDT
jgi:hypothetical protein